MASPALDTTLGNSSVTLTEIPWVVRLLRVTSGATAGTVLHGGPAAAPDLVWGVQTAVNPTGSDYAVTAKSATTITLDFEDIHQSRAVAGNFGARISKQGQESQVSQSSTPHNICVKLG